MDALIQIVDEHDNPVGQATKQEAWKKGLWHRVVRIMIENDRGEILVQHRLPTKDIYPDCWDNSVAGHVDAGEDYLETALRELHEEVGIEAGQLETIGRYTSDEVWHGKHFKHFDQVYRLRYNQTPTKLMKSELDDVRWMTLPELRQLIQEHPDKVTAGLREVIERYYK